MIKKLEDKLSKEVKLLLNSLKIKHRRNNMGYESGYPDYECIIQGFYVGIELKRPDKLGRATLQQQKKKRDIENAGGFSIISDDLEEIKNFIIILLESGVKLQNERANIKSQIDNIKKENKI